MARYSPQRELILSILHETTEHPSAAIVYERARRVMPNISLGTVYRNLVNLSKEGVIQNFGFGDVTHFDGNQMPHAHFCCTKCNEVSDLCCDMGKVNELVEGLSDTDVEHAALLFYGVCQKCKK